MYMIFLMSKIGTLTKRSFNNLSKSQQIIETITTTGSKGFIAKKHDFL